MTVHSSSATSSTPPRRGEQTRQAILLEAVDLASAEGLEGLTIGRLASALGMSKSGLFAHFGSKDELELSTVDAAREIFIDEVLRPGLAARRGLPRLEALCEAWLSYAERLVFRGGCFFAAASAELDSRPGPVRDRVAEVMAEWMQALERAVREAQAAGDLESTQDPAQLAFELHALVMGANSVFQLHGDGTVFERARSGIRWRLAGASARAS